MNTSTSSITQLTGNAIRREVRVPIGHVMLSEKWVGSDVHAALQKVTRTVVSDELGLVDFHPSSGTAVLYGTEVDIVNESPLKRKIVKLRKNNAKQTYIIAQRTGAVQSQYKSLQRFAVLDIGIPTLPFENLEEAAQLLAQMEVVESKEKQHLFLLKRRAPPASAAVLGCLLKVPGLGEVRAKALVDKWHSLKAISQCSMDDLAQVIGSAPAKCVVKFFCNTS
ncbi:unnamed protein product [Ixodes pacificus]